MYRTVSGRGEKGWRREGRGSGWTDTDKDFKFNNRVEPHRFVIYNTQNMNYSCATNQGEWGGPSPPSPSIFNSPFRSPNLTEQLPLLLFCTFFLFDYGLLIS